MFRSVVLYENLGDHFQNCKPNSYTSLPPAQNVQSFFLQHNLIFRLVIICISCQNNNRISLVSYKHLARVLYRVPEIFFTPLFRSAQSLGVVCIDVAREWNRVNFQQTPITDAPSPASHRDAEAAIAPARSFIECVRRREVIRRIYTFINGY